jgi:hypothetical protein
VKGLTCVSPRAPENAQRCSVEWTGQGRSLTHPLRSTRHPLQLIPGRRRHHPRSYNASQHWSPGYIKHCAAQTRAGVFPSRVGDHELTTGSGPVRRGGEDGVRLSSGLMGRRCGSVSPRSVGAIAHRRMGIGRAPRVGAAAPRARPVAAFLSFEGLGYVRRLVGGGERSSASPFRPPFLASLARGYAKQKLNELKKKLGKKTLRNSTFSNNI